jgi:FKBP-type peptidyl-prolyl cis-trans isomerase 2
LEVKLGDTVKIEYTGTLDDGTVFDSTADHGTPFEFQVGSGQVIKGFDEAVIGMISGQEKQFRILPADAYGKHDPGLIQKVPRQAFPADVEIAVGLLFEAGLPTGETIPAKITKIEGDTISVDLNHPLAGHALNFKIKIAGITSV